MWGNVSSPNKETLIGELTGFGLTVNQAIVYLSVVKFDIADVARISQETKLHRQDIYKMMPRLQKMGLVTKKLGKPTKFESLPIGKALKSLLEREKKQAEGRISLLSDNLASLTKEIERFQTQKIPQEKEPSFSLLTNDLEIMNKFEAALEKAKHEWCIVTTPKLAPKVIDLIRESAKNLKNRGIKTRVIIDSHTDEATRNILDRLGRANDFLITKQSSDAFLVPYRIVDDEVWIQLTKETESGIPWFLWTDSISIFNFYKRNFEESWESSAAKPL